LVALATRAGDDHLMLEGFHCRWSTAWFRGEIKDCIANAHEGVARYDREKHSWMGPVFGGHDPGVCAYGVLCQSYALTGEHAEARQCAERARDLAGDIGHPNSVVHALMNSTVDAQIRRDHEAVIGYSHRLLTLSEKYNLPATRSHALFLSGWVKAQTGDFPAGMAIMEAEYPRASAIGPFFRYYAALLAEARQCAGRASDALSLLQSTIATIVEPGVGMYVSELYRLEGICMLEVDPANSDRAVASLQTAATVAHQQGAALLELSAALSLARAAALLGSGDDARSALGALCDALPDDLDVPALTEARQLLADAGRDAPRLGAEPSPR
jgi:predicted ATPase